MDLIRNARLGRRPRHGVSSGAFGVMLCACLALLWPVAIALDNGVGKTPAMGWNSWNYFRCSINETIIREVADAIVASGLKDAGYQYVNIDDCWMEKRDADGRIVPFANKFPSGMKALADYIHSKGLKFGVYSDTGKHTCEGYPGSMGFEKNDAETYAAWGVDYLKYDYCAMDGVTESVQQSYERMHDALTATGRPILFSLCSWGTGQPWLWGQKVGNSWRTGIDVFAVWNADEAKRLKLPSFLQPVLGAVRQTQSLAQYAGPGGFNDPDMLVVGLDGMYPYGIVQDCPEHVKGCKSGMYISRDRWGKVGGLTYTQQRSHFSFWCIMASPLILGNDPRHMSKATLQILLAREVLAISQDPLGKQGSQVWHEGSLEIWTKQLQGGRTAVMLVNLGKEPADITAVFSRDTPAESKQWERDVPDNDPVCVDKEKGCEEWAKKGECTRNAGFMLDTCRKSCPEGCPHPIDPPGPKASALVRDVWLEEDVGVFVGKFTAAKVEPDEARLVVISWMEPADAAKATADLNFGTKAYAKSLRSAMGALGIAVAPSRDEETAAKAGEADKKKQFVRAKELETEVQKLYQDLKAANTKISKLEEELEEVQCTRDEGASADDGGEGVGGGASARRLALVTGRGLVSGAAGGGGGGVWLASIQSKLSIALNLGLAGIVILLLLQPRRRPKTGKDTD